MGYFNIQKQIVKQNMITKTILIGIIILVSFSIGIHTQQPTQTANPTSVPPQIIIETIQPNVVPPVQVINNNTQNVIKEENKDGQTQIKTQGSSTTLQVQGPADFQENNTIIDEAHAHLMNLSAEHQQKLLEQVDALQKVHENPQLRLQELADLTEDQKFDLQRKFAQQARLNYEKIQKQINQKAQKQQDDWLLSEAKLSKTNQFRLKEKMQFEKVSENWMYSRMSHKMNEYMFYVEQEKTEDFMIMLPTDQPIYLQLSLYINKGGVYSRTADIDQEGPLTVFVYENNERLITEKPVYFMSNFYINGKAKSTYTIKFKNIDIPRLVSLQVSVLLENSHVSQVISAADVSRHDDRVDRMYSELEQRFKTIGVVQTLEYANRESLRKGIQAYYGYAIVEIFIIMIVCFVQVQLINRLLNKSSAV